MKVFNNCNIPVIPTLAPLARLTRNVDYKIETGLRKIQSSSSALNHPNPLILAAANLHDIGVGCAGLGPKLTNMILGHGSRDSHNEMSLPCITGHLLAKVVARTFFFPAPKIYEINLEKVLLVPFAIPCAIGAVVGLAMKPVATVVSYCLGIAVGLIAIPPFYAVICGKLLYQALKSPSHHQLDEVNDRDNDSMYSIESYDEELRSSGRPQLA
jgi:hypothetical protein